jgi:signal peptidase I
MVKLRGGGQHGGGAVRQRHVPRAITELAFLVLVVLVTSFALKTFVIQSFYIPSGSMETTLALDDRVIVTKLAPRVLSLHRGDIVVFHDPGGWGNQVIRQDEPRGKVQAWFYGIGQALGFAPADSEEYLIKRLIGLPGDKVSCAGAGAPLTVNGVPLDETYVIEGADPSLEAFSITVPDDAVWVMGDNRPGSRDSRAHQDEPLKGAVAIKDVVGVAQLRTFPLSRFGILSNPGSVFANVP